MTRIVAHRGASYQAPENTLSAFMKAIEIGADGIELDVHLSKDGHIIVCHDTTLERTTNGSGYIKDHSLWQIKQLDAGSWFAPEFQGEPVPTLPEVLHLIKNTGVLLNVELKTSIFAYNGLEMKVLRAVAVYNYLSKTTFSSFNAESLAKLKSIYSGVKLGRLYKLRTARPWEDADSIGINTLLPRYPLVNSIMLKRAYRLGLEVYPYTVDKTGVMRRLIQLGVDGLITNRPSEALEVREELNLRKKTRAHILKAVTSWKLLKWRN